MKRYLLIGELLFVVMAIAAQTLTVNAPSHVQNGENFRLTYTLNTQNASDFRIGDFPDGLELITGPYTSTQSSYTMVNGHTSSSSSITYTFIICAEKNGTYTIPAAHVQVKGKTISSQTAKVTVSGHAAANGSAPKMHDDEDDRHQMRQAGSAISGSDLFIKVSANKRRVHEQEPIMLTYKVYTLVDLTQLEGKMPDLTGFHSQEVKLPQQKSFHIENVNGRNYRCVTWSQYVMFPQMTGKLEIPSITFTGTVVQQNRDVDPFEAFFNGGSGYIEVKRSIKAPGVTIQVDPLPDKPDNFSGGVGRFNISGQLNKNEVKANEPITIRVVVGGTGNLKLIKQPVVDFPKDFDKYDPKVTDKTQLTANGVEGNMVYDFLAVPRNQGKYTIPPVKFIYYDTDANAYRTIQTQPFELNVEKGEGGSGVSVNYAEEQNQDIRPLKTGKWEHQDINHLFFGSTGYWVLLAFLLVLFVTLLIVFRRRAIENADIVKRKGKQANKVATKRLKVANRLMQQQKQSEFYDEVLRALWGYVGDKLNIPVTELSHDNIADRLAGQQVEQDTIDKFIEALDECEFERYAPGDPAGNMNKTYDYAMTAITRIEDSMKAVRKGKGGSFAKGMANHPSARLILIVGFLVSLFMPAEGWALTGKAAPTTSPVALKSSADSAYAKGDYQQAIRIYEDLLKQGESAEIYYNLGNAYYRTDNITKAVLNYERAQLLSPADGDIRFNLQMARTKVIDKITPVSEMFFVTWYRSLVNLNNIDGWARIAVVSMILALILVLVYLFASAVLLRKIGFIGGIAFFLLFLVSNLFAFQQRHILMNRTGAIIIAPSVTVKKTPAANATDQGVLHEGTRVDIIDDTMTDWKEIRIADGNEGWVETKQIEKI